MDNHEVKKFPIPSVLRDNLTAAINFNDLAAFKKEIRSVSLKILTGEKLKQEELECLKFLEEFLIQIYKVYESPINYDANEVAFN
ncbi:hypothetical protein G6F57_007948 [Rhizopus arrhizus]|uniref:Uncharacterized protein n=1 Tax=Rhizopus oryzae TaxID=64495 RepID=A0A9P7BQD8_RHIOR|nr:hypothetical protein G6F23_002981 [Rhizopus arrhizus]KAG1415086.1 hypothetical protein G6F58_006645 [Rhizopus delemar]KAG0761206.1 hypothetical protein G6F24_007742 [Rhizopus arrhizus]KAG0792168.1 hypothetical protein G6F22_005941 [Rhizopus arrhizus]KAG0792694.1 hypothetical protein G6F21_004169 [Rhizopus arrhizus]